MAEIAYPPINNTRGNRRAAKRCTITINEQRSSLSISGPTHSTPSLRCNYGVSCWEWPRVDWSTVTPSWALPPRFYANSISTATTPLGKFPKGNSMTDKNTEMTPEMISWATLTTW